VRILYHHRTLGDGAEGIHIREIVKAFRELGHDVKVIGPVGEQAPAASGKPASLAAVKRAIPSALFELVELAYGGYSFLKTAWEIRRFRPDFVYDRYITFNVGPVLAGLATGTPVLLEVNAPLALERSQEKDETLRLRRIARFLERWICANARHTIVVSTPLKDYLESLGVPGDRCFVMPNGVDPQRFAPAAKNETLREQLGIPPGSFTIGFTGVLRAWHGIELLLEAFAGMVARGLDAFLLIVGDGSYRPTIEARMKELNIEHRVRITGRVPHRQVPTYISLFDVAVSPRATFYASPMKVVEYMALGKPVVTPGTPNFLDIIDDGVHGVTFEDGDAAALEAALVALFQAPDLCAALGQQARRKVETRLNWRWNAMKSCELAGSDR
jgi:glycosyltransferase involved in cell wall biosynthesis